MAKPFKLTDEQKDFIDNAPLESVLIACPGSGKTRTAVLRFIERCRVNTKYGVAFLSYTNVAVEEALTRAREESAGGLVGYPNIVSTIDAFFRRFVFEPFIRMLIKTVPISVNVFESRPPTAIANDNTYKIWGVRPNATYNKKSVPVPLFAWEARAYIADNGSLAYEYNKDAYREDWVDVPSTSHSALEGAKQAQLKTGYATYNDILLFCRLLLEDTGLNIAEILATRFGEIIVDEAQDTSALQQTLLEKLAKAGTKITYVGDPLQGIYQFNRANPLYLDKLAGTTHKQYDLTLNFRSIKRIIDVVNNRFASKMDHDREPEHSLHGAYVFVGSEADARDAFAKLLERLEHDLVSAAIIVPKRPHLCDILEDYEGKGWLLGPRLALEAWQRERRMDFQGALTSVVRLLKNVCDQTAIKDIPDSRLRELGWLYLHGEHFAEPQAGETPKAWSVRLKDGLEAFLKEHGIPDDQLGRKMGSNNIPDKGDALTEFAFAPPVMRTTVIHQVKGETISAVLVIGPEKQHQVWLNPKAKDEEQNVCYVAFTRAADLLLLHCPTEAIAAEWRKHGFSDLPKE